MSDDELQKELYRHINTVSSIRNVDHHYNGTIFYDSTKQVFVTHLTEHISRSLKIGNRSCSVFYKDQPVPPRSSPCVSTIVEKPPSKGSSAQTELEKPGQGISTDNISDANSEDSET